MRNKKSGIYCWTSPSGRQYVGQTIDLQRRMDDFLNFNKKYSSESSGIEKARQKYNSPSEWEYNVLEECEAKLLSEREIYWIDKMNTFMDGYNSTIGGNGTSGHSVSDESRERMSKIKKEYFKTHEAHHKGKPFSEEVRKRMRERREKTAMENGGWYFTGKHHTDETKEKLSKAIKKTLHENPEIIERRMEKFKEFYEKHPEEKEKLSEKKKQYYTGHPEYIEKLKKAAKEFIDGGIYKTGKYAGRPIGEVRSEYLKKYYATHENPMKGKKRNPETVKKMADKHRGKPKDKNKIAVVQLTKDLIFVREWKSATDAQNVDNKFKSYNICKVCKGVKNSCGGYKWMYKDDYDKLNQSSSS